MAATLKIYLNDIQKMTELSGAQSYYLYYTVVCTTTGSTSASSATLTLAHGGSASPTGTGSPQTGLSIPANSSTAVAQVYQHTSGASGTATLQASLNLGSYGTVTASKSVVLGQTKSDATARLSVPYEVTLGESFDITVSGSSARAYDVRCYTGAQFSTISGARGTYFTVLSGVEAGTHAKVIAPSQVAGIMPDDSRIEVSFVVIAYASDGECVCINHDYKATYLSMPSSAVPEIQLVTPSDLSGHKTTYGVYVQRFSDIQVAVQASGVYGSTITDIKNTLDDLTSSGTSTSQHLGTPTTAGNRTLVTVVTDSRGRTTKKRTAITVGAYTAPTIQEFVAQRWGSDGKEDDSSDTVRLSLTGALSVINGHSVTGTATFKGRKNTTGTSLSTIGSTSVSGNFGTTTKSVSNQDVETSYIYEVTLTDSFGQTSTATAQVGTSRPIMDWHVGGKAMGLWTTAREADYQDGTPAEGLFVGSDIILSEGQAISGSGGEDTGDMSYARLLRAGYNYSTDSFILDALQHIVLANGIHVAARNASGTITRLLGINEDGETELNWTSGGIKGRVRKLLWSGTWTSGNITVPEMPYYNVFGITTEGYLQIALRSGGSIVSIGTSVLDNTSSSFNMNLVRFAVNGTTLSTGPSILINPVTNAYLTKRAITQIFGIL